MAQFYLFLIIKMLRSLYQYHYNVVCSPWGISKLNLIDGSMSGGVFIRLPGNCCCWLIMLFGLESPMSNGLPIFLRIPLAGLFPLFPVTEVCCVLPLTIARSPWRTSCDEFRPLFDPPAMNISTKTKKKHHKWSCLI